MRERQKNGHAGDWTRGLPLAKRTRYHCATRPTITHTHHTTQPTQANTRTTIRNTSLEYNVRQHIYHSQHHTHTPHYTTSTLHTRLYTPTTHHTPTHTQNYRTQTYKHIQHTHNLSLSHTQSTNQATHKASHKIHNILLTNTLYFDLTELDNTRYAQPTQHRRTHIDTVSISHRLHVLLFIQFVYRIDRSCVNHPHLTHSDNDCTIHTRRQTHNTNHRYICNRDRQTASYKHCRIEYVTMSLSRIERRHSRTHDERHETWKSTR